VRGSLADGSSAAKWLADYLDHGGATYADGAAFHGYLAASSLTPFPWPDQESADSCPAGCYGSIVAMADDLRSLLDSHGLSGAPLFDTAGSWGNGGVTDPDDQAAWIARWFLLQASLFETDNLRVASWFAWGTRAPGAIEDVSGKPTAAGRAYAQVYRWLVGARITDPCAQSDEGIWSCELSYPNGSSALAVWSANGPADYLPDPTFVDYRDLTGRTVTLNGGTVTVAAKPILLERP
jgi:hypothetical protein